MTYVQRRFYLPEEVYDNLARTAKQQEKTTTQLLRELIENGLQTLQKKTKSHGANALLTISRMAEDKNWAGPADLAEQHDEYFRKENS